MGNPIAEGIQTYQVLRDMDIQDQQLAMQKQSHELAQQQMVNQQAALRFQQGREVRADQLAEETHQGNQAAIQKKNELDATQSVGYSVNNAQAAGQHEVDYNSWTPAQQKVAEDNGWVNTRIHTDGSKVQTIDTSKIDVDGAQQISPIYRDKSAPEAEQIRQGLAVVRSHLDQIAGDMKANPQKYANGAVITREQAPTLFAALNHAIAPSVNKGLDDNIARKEVNTAVINPDGTVSLQVESFDSDGGSFGHAPVTYGRSNGDPESIVMKIPAASLYDYIDINEQLGQQIKAKQVELGDNAPLVEQTAAAKSKRLADGLTPGMMGADSNLDPGAQNRMALVKHLASSGVEPAIAMQAGKLVHPDRVPKTFTAVPNVALGGKLGTAPMDGTTGAIDMSKWQETKQPADPTAAREAARGAREDARDKRDQIKTAKAAVDSSKQRLQKAQEAIKGAFGSGLDAAQEQLVAASADYTQAAADFKETAGYKYDPIGGGASQVAVSAKAAQTATRIKPLTDILKANKPEGGALSRMFDGKGDIAKFLESARAKGWAESDIQQAAKTAGVPYSPPKGAITPAATRTPSAPTPQARPALQPTQAKPVVKVGKYTVQEQTDPNRFWTK
jgi:hypothetical protein